MYQAQNTHILYNTLPIWVELGFGLEAGGGGAKCNGSYQVSVKVLTVMFVYCRETQR